MTQPFGSCDILLSSSLALTGPAANAAIAPTQVVKSTLRIVSSSQIMKLGFAHFSSWFPMRIPFGNGKLAQEGSALAHERNRTKILFVGQPISGHCSILQCGRSEHLPTPSARPRVEVPLDGGET